MSFFNDGNEVYICLIEKMVKCDLEKLKLFNAKNNLEKR